jgi:signal transduction histidine kinase
MVDDQLRRIQRTLRELVGFSRPASKDVTSCDIHEVIDAALNVAKYYKRKKGKHIVTQYAADVPRVAVVRDQMLQVFLNLVLNALDATGEGGTIQITTRLVPGRLEIEVRDDGGGIAPADQRRLFEAYFTTKPTGTGLGLFVCRNIVETAGGRIELLSSAPGATVFRVMLPAADLSPPTAPVAAATHLVETVPR